MKNFSVKKTIFVVFCLFFMNFAISGYSIGEPKSGQKFGDWSIAFTEGKDKKKIWFLTQQIDNVTQDKKKEVLAIYQIGYFRGGKELYLNQIVPTEVAIEPGTGIISDGELIIKGKYTSCTKTGCNSLAPISQKELEKFLSSEKNELGIMLYEGKQINFPISAKGLKEGLRSLK